MKELQVSAGTVILIGEHKSQVCQRSECCDCHTPVLKPIHKRGKIDLRCPKCEEQAKKARYERNKRDPHYQELMRKARRKYKQRHGLNLGTSLSDTHLTNGHIAGYVLLKRGMKVGSATD